MYYEEYGEGDDVLLVHPTPLDRTAWLYQIHYFSEFYHVVIYDQRCFGRSDKPVKRFDVGEFGTDLNVLIKLLDLHCPYIVELSLGGIAAQLAVKRAR